MISVLPSLFDPHALALAAIELKRIKPRLEVKLNEMKTEEESNRRDEHLYPKMNATAFHSLSLPLAPV